MQFTETHNGVHFELTEKSDRDYDKLYDEHYADESITGLDEEGVPRIFMDAEKCAIIRMVIDHDWQTPAMRWSIIEQAYTEMRKRLRAKGYGSAYCFFADGVPNGYIRRLCEMGAERVIDRCVRFKAEEV